jgi:hypothetical protein
LIFLTNPNDFECSVGQKLALGGDPHWAMGLAPLLGDTPGRHLASKGHPILGVAPMFSKRSLRFHLSHLGEYRKTLSDYWTGLPDTCSALY